MFRKSTTIVLLVLALAALACNATSRGERSPQAAADRSGEQIFQSMGCAECHAQASFVPAPSLDGVFGSEVQLENGETVIADEEYIRESILSPEANLVSGYEPIMPSYQDRLTEEELEALIEYISSLAN